MDLAIINSPTRFSTLSIRSASTRKIFSGSAGRLAGDAFSAETDRPRTTASLRDEDSITGAFGKRCFADTQRRYRFRGLTGQCNLEIFHPRNDRRNQAFGNNVGFACRGRDQQIELFGVLCPIRLPALLPELARSPPARKLQAGGQQSASRRAGQYARSHEIFVDPSAELRSPTSARFPSMRQTEFCCERLLACGATRWSRNKILRHASDLRSIRKRPLVRGTRVSISPKTSAALKLNSTSAPGAITASTASASSSWCASPLSSLNPQAAASPFSVCTVRRMLRTTSMSCGRLLEFQRIIIQRLQKFLRGLKK